MTSRRALFSWLLLDEENAEKPTRKEVVISPEIAARAEKFRAERAARATTTTPAGPISWLADAECPPPEFQPSKDEPQ
jgi:hypothetical protein